MKTENHAKQYAAVLQSRQVGDIVTLDPSDLQATPLCFASRDTSYKSSQVAEVRPVRRTEDSRLENIAEECGREILQMVPGARVVVEIVATHVSLPTFELQYTKLDGTRSSKTFPTRERLENALAEVQKEHPSHDCRPVVVAHA